MAQAHENRRKDGVSPQTDELSSALMGHAFDVLAAGDSMGVLLVVGDAQGQVASYEFADDGQVALIKGAKDAVGRLVRQAGDKDAGLGAPVRYALAYEGAVADEDDSYQDALLLEFGEKGYKSYSAYSYVKGKGEGDRFAWTDPAPAGEVGPLL